MRKPHSSEISDKLVHGANSIWSNEKRTAYIRKWNIYWIYLIGAVLLYTFGVTLVAQGFLYLALLVMTCGGACFLTGLRQAEKRRTKLNKDTHTQQKLAVYKSLHDEPSYPSESGRVVEGDKPYNDIYSFEEYIEPILIFQINEKVTRNDLQSYITIWENRLARKEPFGVLIVQYDEASQSDQEIIKLGHQWHRAHKSHVSRYCVGVAVVTTSTRLLEPGSSATRAMRIWLGCPGQICTTEIEARAWLCRQLEQDKKTLS